jgi:hypothetical protein
MGFDDRKNIYSIVFRELERSNGILRIKPTWVARDFLPSGRNLGLDESEYDVGIRGEICERWIGSTTLAINPNGPEDEGMSYLLLEDDYKISLGDVLKTSKELLMGKKYAENHNTLGRLAKIYSYSKRVFYHMHQKQKDAELVGSNGKDEAYYFPEDVDMGSQPETFFGVHPYISEEKRYDILLPYLENWNNDLILKHSRAYLQIRGEGFYLPAGIPHAPGTVLTVELQEESDVFSNMQAMLNGKILSKETLFRSIRNEDRKKFGERIILKQIDWEKSGDPYFYENSRTIPILITETKQIGGEEYWIFFNTRKFSGKKLIVKPGNRFTCIDNGVYTVLVWKGKGEFDGKFIESGNFENDEFIVSYDRAIKPLEVKNTGKENLILFKFFGKDINLDIPMLPLYKGNK